MKKLQVVFFFSLTLLLSSPMLSAQESIGKLCGTVLFEDQQEEAIGANVIAYRKGVFAAGASTDFDGHYCMNLDPGEYELEVSYIGTPTFKASSIIIQAGKTITFDVELQNEDFPDYGLCHCCHYVIPLIDMDEPGPTPIHRSDIELQPVKEVRDLMINFPGVSIGN